MTKIEMTREEYKAMKKAEGKEARKQKNILRSFAMPTLTRKAKSVVAGAAMALTMGIFAGTSYACDDTHTVSSGETLSSISKHYHTDVASLKYKNQLSSNTIRVNQKLIVPLLNKNGQLATCDEPLEAGTVIYRIQKGDTLPNIVNNFNKQGKNVSIEQVRKDNYLNGNTIIVGRNLIVKTHPTTKPAKQTVSQSTNSYKSQQTKPVNTTKPSTNLTNQAANNKQTNAQKPNQAPVTSHTTQSKTISYTVKSGDTLYSISKRYHTTVSAIKQTNHLKSNTIYIKQTLRLPAN